MKLEVDKDKRAVLIYDKAEYEDESDLILLMYLLDNNVNLNNINLDTAKDVNNFRKDNKGKVIQFATDIGRGIELGSGIKTVADKIEELSGKRPDIQKLKTSEMENLDLAKIDEILGTNYVELYRRVKQNTMEPKLEQEDGIKDEPKRGYLEENERRNELQLDCFEL